MRVHAFVSNSGIATAVRPNRDLKLKQYFQMVNIKYGEAAVRCLRSHGKCQHQKQYCTERKEILSVPLNYTALIKVVRNTKYDIFYH